MKLFKYISVFALAIVFAMSSCTKIGSDLVECESSEEKVTSPEATMVVVSEDDEEDYAPGGGITDPDHDEDHDTDEEKVVVIN